VLKTKALAPQEPSKPASVAPLVRDAHDLVALSNAARLAPPALDENADELSLSDAALELRHAWLRRAHGYADDTLKSPREGTTASMPDGETVSLGYERDLDVSALETREPLDHANPGGWSSARLLCRSGQAALSCVLHLVSSLAEDACPLSVHHAGRYFETKSLLALWPRAVIRISPATMPVVDLLIGEPVYCDGHFGITEPTELPRIRSALILDTTLSGTELDLQPWFEKVEGNLVAVLRSGLKLDQAGLELANAGIIQLFVRERPMRKSIDLADAVARLQNIRALTGAGLTLDEMAALSAPWFLNSEYFRSYSRQVFTHNEALALAIGSDSHILEGCCHPALLPNATRLPAVAPFCAIRLRQGSLQEHRQLVRKLEAEFSRRGLALERGGSFGFRSTRYELIQPASGEGVPFVRVAVGFRGGPSVEALIHVMGEIAHGDHSPR
jgi:hypothetical protein